MTLIAGSATGIGGALVLFKKKLSSKFLAGSLGLSAGVMIFISMAEMLPESQGLIRDTGLTHGEAFVLWGMGCGVLFGSTVITMGTGFITYPLSHCSLTALLEFFSDNFSKYDP